MAVVAKNALTRSLQSIKGDRSRSSSPARCASPRLDSPSRSSATPRSGGAAAADAAALSSMRSASWTSASGACPTRQTLLQELCGDTGSGLSLGLRTASLRDLREGWQGHARGRTLTHAEGEPRDRTHHGVGASMLKRSSLPGAQAATAAAAMPGAAATVAGAASDPASPSAAATPQSDQSARQKQVIKIAAKAGQDISRVAQLITSPLDGMLNVAADSGCELLLKRLAGAGSGCVSPLAGGPASPSGVASAQAMAASVAATPSGLPVGAAAASSTASPTGMQYNPVHARVLSVLVSTVLSGAAASSGAAAHSAAAMPHMLQSVLAQGSGVEVVRALDGASDAVAAALRARLGDAAGHAAPALKASDAEDAIGAGTVAASAGLRMAMRAGSNATAALPDLTNILDGVLGSVHDSIDEMDLPAGGSLLQLPKLPGQAAQQRSSAGRAT